MIIASDVFKAFSNRPVLDNISLQIPSGEVVGLVGPNGAGKSTLLKIFAGVLEPDSGSINVAGYDVLAQPLNAKRRIGYLPETPPFFDVLTPSEHVQLIGDLHAIPRNQTRVQLRKLFALFDIEPAADSLIRTLSKGTRQKVGLCGALTHEPSVLLLDEPFDGLDIETSLLLRHLLRQLSIRQRVTTIVSSHLTSVLGELVTMLVVLRRGRVVASGTPTALSASSGKDSLEEALGSLAGLDPPNAKIDRYFEPAPVE